MKKLLFVVNIPEFFISHRLSIALAAQKAGYEVHVATGSGKGIADIIAHGLKHHKVGVARSGQNPLREMATLVQLYRLFKTFKPDLVHLITIKPVLYGGVAARLANVPAVVSAVSGLGTVFLGHSGIAGMRRQMVSFLYRLAFNHPGIAVICQNPDDREKLIRVGALKLEHSRMIRGSGVDLTDYPALGEPDGTPVVTMAARLLKDKGVLEFVEAARILHNRGVGVVMRLIGSVDPGNPTTVSQKELDEWAEEGIVTLLGYRSDIASQYAMSNVVCLPSYYGEGLPKSLIEAAACGRAVITTDHPGCRDAIEPGKTGLLVPVKNPVALADAIQKLIEAPELRRQMGEAGRVLAEEVFSIDTVVDQHLQIYEELLGESSKGI